MTLYYFFFWATWKKHYLWRGISLTFSLSLIISYELFMRVLLTFNLPATSFPINFPPASFSLTPLLWPSIMVLYIWAYSNIRGCSQETWRGKWLFTRKTLISVKWTESGCYLAWNHAEWPWKIFKSNQENNICALQFIIGLGSPFRKRKKILNS